MGLCDFSNALSTEGLLNSNPEPLVIWTATCLGAINGSRYYVVVG